MVSSDVRGWDPKGNLVGTTIMAGDLVVNSSIDDGMRLWWPGGVGDWKRRWWLAYGDNKMDYYHDSCVVVSMVPVGGRLWWCFGPEWVVVEVSLRHKRMGDCDHSTPN